VVASPADEEVAAFVGNEARIRGRVVAAKDGLVVVDLGVRPGIDPIARGEELLRSMRTDAPRGAGSAGDPERDAGGDPTRDAGGDPTRDTTPG
jgi:hypothetical protein